MKGQYKSVSKAGFKIHFANVIPFSEKKPTETWITIYTGHQAIFVLKTGDFWQHCWFKVFKIPFLTSV